MTSTDKLRNKLIDKIMMIHDKDFLTALDKLLSASNPEKTIQLSPAQESMLRISEQDIKEGKLISQEEMDKADREWLSGR